MVKKIKIMMMYLVMKNIRNNAKDAIDTTNIK